MKDWLELLLPTKLSRLIAGMTPLLAPAAYSLPSILPDSWLPIWPETLLLVRIVLLLLTLLLCSLATLYAVVIGYKQLRNQFASDIESIVRRYRADKAHDDFMKMIEKMRNGQPVAPDQSDLH